MHCQILNPSHDTLTARHHFFFGVALGFGAQTLVKDYISGIFLIIEDQYGIGDEVEIGTVRGRVEAVALRTTRVRDEAGVLWYIRNGEILNVANFSQNTTWEK